MHSQKVREHVPPAFDGRPVLRMFDDPGHMDFYAQVAFPVPGLWGVLSNAFTYGF